MAGEAFRQLKNQVAKFDAYARARKRLFRPGKYGSPAIGGVSQQHLKSYGSTPLNWRKVANKRLTEMQENTAIAAEKKRTDRMLQLAAMPKGRGDQDLKRMLKGGGIEETRQEKARRVRMAQLEKMPENRGKKLLQKMTEMASGKVKPTTITQAGGPGKKSPGLADGSNVKAAEAKKAAETKVKNTAEADAKKAAETRKAKKAAEAKKKAEEAKKAAEAKKKAEMAKKLAALSGKK